MATAQATAPEYRIGQTRIGQLAIAGEDLTGRRTTTSHSITIVALAQFVGVRSTISWLNPIIVSVTTEVYPGVVTLGQAAPGHERLRRDLRKVTIEVE